MLIGIDASRAVKKQKTGTEYYSQQVIFGLAKIDKKNQYILYAAEPPEASDPLSDLPRNFRWKIMPFPRFWSQIRLSWEFIFGREKLDIIFEPAHTIPIFHPKKIAVTIHDLGFKYFPELYTPFERKYHNFSMDFSAKHAAHIITPSEFSKKDIIKIYKIPPEKITVIYHGYNKELYWPVGKNEKISAEISKLKPYIFFIGRIEEKKNILGMLATYELLQREKGIVHKLVLAGRPGWGYDKIKEKINSLPREIRQDIVELGYTPEDKVAEYMRNADIFFFPSFFEGFGMPVIEAMASGAPVVASNVASLPEIVGEAGILVNPRNPAEMATALRRLIQNKKSREKLVAKGLARARDFDWQKSAKEHLAVFERIAKSE